MKLDKLKTKCIGRNLINYEVIDSTQKEAWRLIDKNISNGSIIISEFQTSGIGTHGRKWYTDFGGNIAFSIVLYPNCNIANLDTLTLDIAMIIVDVFKNLYHVNLEIKHPNDIVINGKKLGGILTETKLSGEIVKSLVIGIGINVNEGINEEIKDIATSIKHEYGVAVNREEVVAEICNLLEVHVELLFRLQNII